MKIPFLWLGLLSARIAFCAQQAAIDFNHSVASNNLHIAWNAYPGKSYVIQSATNLTGAWSNSSSFVATSNSVRTAFPMTANARFFRVVKLDTEGPEIVQSSPINGGIAVSRRSAVQMLLYDATGVNTNSISVTLGTNAPVTLSDPRLTFATNLLTYLPATNEFLGTNGQFVSARLSAADLLGNQTTNATWTFQLELAPVMATNIYFIGAGPPGCNLTLLSTNGNAFTFSYSGLSSCLSTGLHLVDTNLLTGYTRTVVAFTEYPSSNTVVVTTRPTKLAELFQAASVNTGGFVDLSPQPRARSWFGTGSTDYDGGIDFNYQLDLERVLFQSGPLLVEITANSYLNLSGRLEASANFWLLRLREFQAHITANADLRLEARVVASGDYSDEDEMRIFGPIRKQFGMMVGFIPVTGELVFELEAGYEVNIEGTAEISGGIEAKKEYKIGARWDEANGWSPILNNPATEMEFLGPTWQVESSSDCRIFVRPKLSLYVYSTAGLVGDFEPFVVGEGRVQLNPPCFEGSVAGGLDAHLGIDLKFWDDKWDEAFGELPDKEFNLIPPIEFWQTNSCLSNPVIVLQPQNQSVLEGQTAEFTVEATGGELTYQWQRDGLDLTEDGRITGVTNSVLQIANVNSNDLGGYSVVVANEYGTTNSAIAELTSYSGGQVLIPAGSFLMGDPFGDCVDCLNGETPVHSVYVSSFYMDRYPVTKALWQEVYNWAMANGYGFDNPGVAKASDHPVHTINWFDAVKWCNARSQKDGLTPCYYTDGGFTNVYKTGQVTPEVKWLASGYRLPTEAEWEKAARGGAASLRFPWGNTISWSQANYLALASGVPGHQPYDLNGTGTIHPAWDYGSFPRTSSVGYFAPNGYGAYDTAGNIEQWCWDWFDENWYSTGAASLPDTRGPASSPYGLRVTRNGDMAISARNAYRMPRAPDSSFFKSSRWGFRSAKRSSF